MTPFLRPALLVFLAAAAARAQDPPLAAGQQGLLELAFDAASALPENPHTKTKARLQESVVLAGLELGQAGLAATQTEHVSGWRQAICLAELAMSYARRGGAEQALHCLERASAAADTELADPNAQVWRRDRARARIAAVYQVLGKPDLAARFGTGLVDNEAASAMADRAQTLEAKQLEACIADVDGMVAGGDFEQVRGALTACAVLYDRFYADAEQRAAMARRVESAYQKLPIMARLELLDRIADAALRHGDADEARRIVALMQVRFDAAEWLPEDHVPRLARIAGWRGRAGDVELARKGLDAALAEFTAQRQKIVDIARAGALRPVAEAYQALGDRDQALRLFRQVADEGVANPNSRPRAEDFVATCLALVRIGLEPDAGLLQRLRDIRGGLGEPW